MTSICGELEMEEDWHAHIEAFALDMHADLNMVLQRVAYERLDDVYGETVIRALLALSSST
jgi:hypothetical protein